MQEFFATQKDYILAAFALGLLAVGALSWRLHSLQRVLPRLPWAWFAVFSVLLSLSQFVDVVQNGFGANFTLRVLAFALLTLAFLALLEFDIQVSFAPARRDAGRLIALPIVGLIGLASIVSGWQGLLAGVHYGLGLTSGLWAARIIWVRAVDAWEGDPRDADQKHGGIVATLRAVAWIFAILMIVVGLFPPFPSFFPASILNTDSFFASTGIPIELFRAVAGLAMASLLWLFIIDATEEEARDIEFTQRLPDRRWPIILGIAVLLLGWGMTDYLGDIALSSLNSEKIQLLDSLVNQLKLNTETSTAVLALSRTDEMKSVLTTSAYGDIRKAVTVLDWYVHTYNLSACYVVDSNGVTVAASTGRQAVALNPKELTQQDFFQRALRGETGEDYLKGEKSTDRALFVAYPVTDFQNQVLGVAIIKRNVGYINSLLGPVQIAFLVSPQHTIFLSSHLDLLDTPIDKIHGPKMEIIPLGNLPALFYQARINDEGWAVALLASQQKVYAMRLMGMGIVIVFLILTFSLTQGFEIRRVTAARIAASEKRYRSLTEGMPNAVFLLDREGHFLAANQVGLEAMGLTTEALLSRSFVDVWPVPARQGIADLLKLVAGGGRWSQEETMPVPDGPPVIWQVVLSPILNADGSVDRIHALMTDITDRKRAEEELSAEKERLTVTLRSIGDGVITTDRTGAVALMNRVAEDLTGWSMAEAQGHPLEEVLSLWNDQTSEPVENLASRILTEGPTSNPGSHSVLKTRRGTEHLIAESGAPIIGREGQAVGVVIVFRDVAEELRMESEMMRIQRLESVGLLAGGIAHDFNNLLVAIMGSVSLALRRANEGDEVIRHLGNAEQALGRASALTQQLLTFAKGGEPIRSAAAISEILSESLGFAVRGSNVSTKVHIAKDIWLVDADAGQIGRVVHNLVLNAVQAMPLGGTVALKARNVIIEEGQNLALDPGPYVEVTVTDTGIGIPEQDLEHIFVPYFSTKQQGSGLGLAIAYSVIKKHRGHLTVQSRVGTGTTFTFYLPAIPGAVVKPAYEAHTVSSGRGRVLIMDDDTQVREVIQEMAESLGYEAVGTRDGKEVVARYREALEAGNPFDVVILDLVIPGGMGGEEAIRALQAIDQKVKGVVSSGYSTDSIMSDYREYGFSGVIAKPFRIDELGAVLARLTGKSAPKS